MIKSMTGYGYHEKVSEEYKISVEIKSVNHRYNDVNIKLPRKFNAMESQIRGILKEYASRGKVDVYINFENYADRDVRVSYHESVAADYMEAIRKAQQTFGLSSSVSPLSLVHLPEVITLEEGVLDAESLFPAVEEAVRAAGAQFLAARETEGQHLQEDILEKLDGIDVLVSYVEKRSPEMLAEYREKIYGKVQELLEGNRLDEGVLATELIIYADKVCVDEETVRLRSHMVNMKETLSLEEAVGRKLDFIAQEMNREANTILSKANDKELSRRAIDLKTEIEKIREQIQNIE